MSKLQRDVSSMLYDMGIDHVCEYDEEEFALDIVLMPIELRVCIEVDGPVHYTVNTLRPVGATLLKRRLLRCLGWQVRLGGVGVPSGCLGWPSSSRTSGLRSLGWIHAATLGHCGLKGEHGIARLPKRR